MPVVERPIVTLRVAGAALAAVCAASALVIAAPALQKTSDRTIFAFAVGTDGKFVTDMKQDDWALREDGTDRVITAAKPSTDPIDLVLVIDTAKESEASISDLRAGLAAFAKAIFAGSTPVTMSIINSAGSAIMVQKDKKTLDDVTKPLEKTFPDQTQNTVILEALSDAAKKLAKSPTPRREIVVVNMDGVPEGSSFTSQQVLREIIDSRAALWTVTYQNMGTKQLSVKAGAGANAAATSKGAGGVGQGDIGSSRDFVLQNAGGTGGIHLPIISATSDLANSLTQIAQAIQGQYAITYTRPEGPQPKQLQMGSTRSGVRVFYPQVPMK